jgi:hypothetical protein
METKSFIKLLRKVIREEVQLVVRKEMRAMLNEKKVNHTNVIKHGMDLHAATEQPRGPIAKKKKFVKDTMLNDILNETAYGSDFSTMNDGSAIYQSSMVNEFATSRQSTIAPIVTNDVNGVPVNMQNKNVARTVDIMTKDYSQLMKAIDKKKGN